MRVRTGWRRAYCLLKFAMPQTDVARRILLWFTASVFVAVALYALIAPEHMAQGLGYRLQAPNGYSEFFAVYVGVWLATAGLAMYAARHIRQAIFGDLVTFLVLAQPVGRCIAIFEHGLPTGPLFYIFLLEVLGGLALLAVRPSA